MAGYIGSKASVVSSGAERKKVITATAGQTSFTGLTYSPNRVHVFQNGVRLVDGTDYTATDGTSLTLTVGALADDQVVVVSYSGFQTSDTVSSSAGGTFTGDVNFTGAFTSQGIDDNATSTAMTLDASGNLLVGGITTLPSSSVNGFGVLPTGIVVAAVSNDKVTVFNRNSSDGEISLFQRDNVTVGSIGTYAGDLTIGDDDIGIRFDTGSGLVPWDLGATSTGGSARDAAIDIGVASARFKDLYLSGGVYLGGTGSDNKISDYETGTYTPSVVSGTISTSRGSYVKVGDLVTVTGTIGGFSDTTTANDIECSMPFTSASGDRFQAHGSVMSQRINFGTSFLTAYLNDNYNYLRFYINSPTSTWAAADHNDVTGSSAFIRFTITYRAA